MFAFFLNGTFLDFWANKPGDIFFDLTVSKLGWSPETVTLVHFPGIPVRRPEFFRFDENKNLIIQEKQLSEPIEIPVEGGEPGQTQTVQEEILVDVQTITGVAYVVDGEKLIQC
jgi:hypothetical protein